MSYFALEFRYPTIEIDHALLQVLAETADVQIVGRRVVQLPLAKRAGQLQPRFGERRPQPRILAPRPAHQIVQFCAAIVRNLRPRAGRNVAHHLATGQRRIWGATWNGEITEQHVRQLSNRRPSVVRTQCGDLPQHDAKRPDVRFGGENVILQRLRCHPANRQRRPFAIAAAGRCRCRHRTAAVRMMLRMLTVERTPIEVEPETSGVGTVVLSQLAAGVRIVRTTRGGLMRLRMRLRLVGGLLQVQSALQIDGHAEIADFTHAVVIEEDVAGGQVAMDDLRG